MTDAVAAPSRRLVKMQLFFGIALGGVCIKQQQLFTQCPHQESLHLRYGSFQRPASNQPVAAGRQTYELRADFGRKLSRAPRGSERIGFTGHNQPRSWMRR